jgi:hypothetical protein
MKLHRGHPWGCDNSRGASSDVTRIVLLIVLPPSPPCTGRIEPEGPRALAAAASVMEATANEACAKPRRNRCLGKPGAAYIAGRSDSSGRVCWG